MQEVIRIEPRASSAWNVLARCYESSGDNQKALQLRIMGAHLNQDPEEWEALAQKSKYELRIILRSLSFLTTVYHSDL